MDSMEIIIYSNVSTVKIIARDAFLIRCAWNAILVFCYGKAIALLTQLLLIQHLSTTKWAVALSPAIKFASLAILQTEIVLIAMNHSSLI